MSIECQNIPFLISGLQSEAHEFHVPSSGLPPLPATALNIAPFVHVDSTLGLWLGRSIFKCYRNFHIHFSRFDEGNFRR